MGTAVAQWLRCCTTNRKVAGSIPAGVNGFFLDTKSFRSHYGPGVDSASNRNECQEYFLGVKSGRCVRLTTLSPSCATVKKSGSLNFLEPSGPVQACNGTALPFFNNHKNWTSIHSAGFCYAIPAFKWLQTYAYPQGRKIYLIWYMIRRNVSARLTDTLIRPSACHIKT